MTTLVIGATVVTPFGSRPMTPMPGLLTVFSTAMVVNNLLLAAMLFIKGRVDEGPDTIRLGAAYLYCGLIVIPQTMSFPGALTAAPLIGTQETSLWFWIFWHVGFGLAVIRYAWFFGRPSSHSIGLLLPIAEVIAVTSVAVYIAVVWARDLPSLIIAGHFSFTGAGLLAHAVVALVVLAALFSVAQIRAPTPEQLWLVVGLTATCVEVWLTLESTGRFTLGWYLAKVGSLLTALFVLVSLMHEITFLYSEAASNNRVLANLARNDGLTGLSNRRHFDEMLTQELVRARRINMPLALIMVDVDHFKNFNDSYGHPAGDDCLRRVASAIKSALRRATDVPFRYGGEEFAILLPATNLDGAKMVAENILAAVADLNITHVASTHGIVTVSAGVSAVTPITGHDMASELVEAADHALYRAKAADRNNVQTQNVEDSPASGDTLQAA